MTHLDLSHQNICDAADHRDEIKNIPAIAEIVLKSQEQIH